MSSKALTFVIVVAAQLSLFVTAAHAGAVNVPEPTTMGLLGVGAAVAAVGAWWWRRK